MAVLPAVDKPEDEELLFDPLFDSEAPDEDVELAEADVELEVPVAAAAADDAAESCEVTITVTG